MALRQRIGATFDDQFDDQRRHFRFVHQRTSRRSASRRPGQAASRRRRQTGSFFITSGDESPLLLFPVFTRHLHRADSRFVRGFVFVVEFCSEGVFLVSAKTRLFP